MISLDKVSYSPAIAALLRRGVMMPLGPGTPELAVRAQLAELTPEAVVAPLPVRDRDMALSCMAGLWLRFNHLEESHQISQNIKSPTGSYWHAILHRREPDFDNAKFWFRRVGKHPVLDDVATAVCDMEGTGSLPTMGLSWDPLAFVDLCQSVHNGDASLEIICRQIQQREWELLFGYSVQMATR